MMAKHYKKAKVSVVDLNKRRGECVRASQCVCVRACVLQHCPFAVVRTLYSRVRACPLRRAVDAWNSEHLPIYEPGLEGELATRVGVLRQCGRLACLRFAVGWRRVAPLRSAAAQRSKKQRCRHLAATSHAPRWRRPLPVATHTAVIKETLGRNLFISTDVAGGIADADIVFIAVNTGCARVS